MLVRVCVFLVDTKSASDDEQVASIAQRPCCELFRTACREYFYNRDHSNHIVTCGGIRSFFVGSVHCFTLAVNLH